MKFIFKNLKHSKQRRGVFVKGDIFRGENKVGTFEIPPMGACLTYFDTPAIANDFEQIAAEDGLHPTSYGENLCSDAEELLLAE